MRRARRAGSGRRVGSVGLRAFVALLEGSSPDDMLFLQGLLPARIESVSVGRGAGGGVELFIRVLDARQRVMVTSTTCLWTTRKRVRISTAADT